MYGKLVRVLYDLHMLFQALFCLALPVFLAVGGGWLLVRYAAVGEWVYALAIPLGVLSGLWSMIHFLMKTAAQIRAVETERTQREAERRRAARDEEEG